MKLRYFMLPVIIVSLMILVLEKEKNIENRTIFNENKEISYPFFNTPEIDNYISNYLSEYITTKEDILIDYDYVKEDAMYYLTFYQYIFDGNKISNKKDSLLINTEDNTITKIRPISYEYDVVHNKIINNENKLIALTFDDGPNYNTNKVLDVLEKYNITATFFVLGSKIKGNEYILKRIVNSGHQIGNHTFNHLLLSRYDEETVLEEIKSTSDLIFEVTGTYPSLFRPSYGSVNSKIKKVSECPIIIWDIDTLDWKYHNSDRIAKRVINKARDGDIVLMHDVYSATANSLNVIIPKLQEKGYTFVTVSELFYYKGVELEKGKVYGYAN